MRRERRDAARARTSCSAASATRSCPRAAPRTWRSCPTRTCSGSGTRTCARRRSCWARLVRRAPDDPLVPRPRALAAAARKNGRWGNTQENARRAGGARRLLQGSTRRSRRTSAPSSPSAARRWPRQEFRGRSTTAQAAGRAHEGRCAAQGRAGASALDLAVPRARDRGHALLRRAAQVRRGRARCRTGSTRASAIERTYAPATAAGEAAGGEALTSFKAGDLVRVTLTLRLTKERRYVAVTDPLPAGFEPVESWFATTASDLVARAGRAAGVRRTGLGLVAARRLRPRRAPRRPRAALRHAPRGGRARLLLRRAGHHRRARSGPRPPTPRRCTSRRSSAAPAPPWSRCSRDAARGVGTLAAALAAGDRASLALGGRGWARCPPACSTWTPHVSTEVVDRATASPLLRSALRARAAQPPHRPRPASRRRSCAPPWPRRTRASSAIPASTRSRSRAPSGTTSARGAWSRADPPSRSRRSRCSSTATRTARRASCARPCSRCALEHRLAKREILALYLNVAPYGNQLDGRGGGQPRLLRMRAAETSPRPRPRSWPALPQRPTALDPYRHDRGGARGASSWVLERMRSAAASSSAEDYAAARDERLRIVRTERAFLAPHFVERALRAAVPGPPAPAHRDHARRRAAARGARASWTVHRRAAPRATARTTSRWRCSTTRTGEWLAWEGSGDYVDAGPRRRDRRRHHAAPARLRPEAVHVRARLRAAASRPASVLPDLPAHFPTAASRASSTARATTTASSAARCARAPRWPARRTCPRCGSLSRVGVPDLLRLLRRAGLTTLDKTRRPLRVRAHHGRRRGARSTSSWPPTRRSRAAAS